MTTLHDVKAALWRARKLQNLSQTDLANLAGVSQQMICKVEGDRYAPSLDVIERIAKALSLEVHITFKKTKAKL